MIATTANTPPATKHCNCCGHELPSAEFRRIYADRDWPLHSECNACRNARERERRQRGRRKTLKRQLTALAAVSNERRLSALSMSMIQSAGGYDRFCQQFAALRDAPNTTPATRQRIFASILHVISAADASRIAVEAQRQAEEERRHELMRDKFGRMSRDELEQYLAGVLRQAGWRVRPPRE